MPAGYSKRRLPEKLGIKPGFRICILNAPANYADILGALPTGVKLLPKLKAAVDFIQFFARQRSELERAFPLLRKELAESGMLWISWPKGASKIPTDVNENVVREIGLKNQMVDIKVCAVDEAWSGLKFVYRLKDRTAKS
jgi:hypothetical protein